MDLRTHSKDRLPCLLEFRDKFEELEESKKKIVLYIKEQLSLELREDFKLKRTTHGLNF